MPPALARAWERREARAVSFRLLCFRRRWRLKASARGPSASDGRGDAALNQVVFDGASEDVLPLKRPRSIPDRLRRRPDRASIIPPPPTPASIILSLRHGGASRRLQYAAATPGGETKAVIGAAFSVAADRVVGLLSAEGVYFPISFLSKAPSFFSCAAGAVEDPVFALLVGPEDSEGLKEPYEDEYDDDETPAALPAAAAGGDEYEAVLRAADAAFRRDFGDGAFHLREFQLKGLFAVFCCAADDGALHRSAYSRCASECIEGAALGADAQRRASAVFARVWSTFERYCPADAEAEVDVSVLLAGLSVVAAGSDSKVAEMFSLFDADGDGVVSFDEMTRYLFAVFAVTRESDPAAFAASLPAGGRSLGRLAFATAEHCFEEADVNHDGVITFPEFAAWRTAAAPPIKLPDLAEARRVMGLAQADPVSFCDHLLRHASSGGVVSKAVFSQCVAEFAPRCGEGAEAARHAVVRRIFRLFDAANDDAVDALELAAGVTALCGGSRDRKVSAVLGADGRTLLSLPQLASYFYAIFRVLCDAQCESEDSSGESTDDDAASLALATAEQCFAELRPAGGACICVDEFRAWYEASGGAAEDAAVDDAASAEGAASSGGSGALGALRNAAGLGAYDVHHVSEMFRNVRCDRVDRNAFHECLGALRLNAVAPALLGADSARDVFEYVYDALDAAHAGLNKAELVVGLSILCRGSARARVREALDVLGEGEAVSYDAAHAYLRAVFRFVFSLKSDKGAGGGPDADAVARQTAARAFTDSGVATDEDLDVKVFADWYAANVRLAEPGAPFRAPQQQALHECIEAVALRAGVAGQAVHVATQRVFSAADARGTLDRRAFSQALQCDGETAEDTRKLFDCIRTKTSTRVRSGVPAAALRPPRGAW